MEYRPDTSLFLTVAEPYKFQEGLPTIIECFGTYCGPCRQMIPELSRIAESHHSKINLISVSSESFNQVNYFYSANSKAIKYNIASDPTGIMDKLMQRFGVRGIPCAFIFNKNNEYVYHGHPASREFRETLDYFLKY